MSVTLSLRGLGRTFVSQYKMSLTFVKVSVNSLSFHSSDNYTSLKVRAHTRKFTLTFHLIFHPSQADEEHLLFLCQELPTPPHHPSFLYFLLHWYSQHDMYLLFLSDKTETAPWCHSELGTYEIICCLIKIIALSESSERATSLLFDG